MSDYVVKLPKFTTLPSRIQSYLKSSGSPHYLLSHGISIPLAPRAGVVKRCNIDWNGSPINISADRQIDWVDSTAANPLRGSYVYCIASKLKDKLTSQVGLYFVVEALRSLYEQKNNIYRGEPVWHKVTGSFKDQLRDEPKDKRKIRLLVIDGVIADMEPHRRGKIVDLMDKYEHVPRIILAYGKDPLTLCLEELKLRPNRILSLDPAHKIISI